jgi:hypothetical protein
MKAERLYLATDGQGNLTGLPKLPPNRRLEAIFLLLDDDTDTTPTSTNRRGPSSILKGSVTVVDDLTAPILSDDEWDASLERTARQINGDPEAFK